MKKKKKKKAEESKPVVSRREITTPHHLLKAYKEGIIKHRKIDPSQDIISFYP